MTTGIKMMTAKLAINAGKVQLRLQLTYRLLYRFLVGMKQIRAIKPLNFNLYTLNSTYSIPLSRIFINSE